MHKASNRLKSFNKPDLLFSLVVALGIVLRLVQYFANRSFWVDEASLALNIVNRTFGALTLPLDYNQGAPIGFLFIEKFAILILGNNEYSLRLFPLFSGLLSVYLIYRIAKEQFGISGLFAVLLISISTPLIYYSSELKQYSSDVMFALLLVYLSILCLRENPRTGNFILLGIAGVLSIWISHPSAFVLAGIGLILAVEKLLKKTYSQLAWILGMGLMWLLMLGMTYLISLRYLIGSKYLENYWFNDFMPLPPWSHLDWYKNAFASLLTNISPSFNQLYLVEGCFVLILIGMVSLFLRSRKIALIIISPFLVASIASAMQKYPLGGRLILFLVPFATLLMAEGLGRIYSICAIWNRNVAVLLSGSLAMIILWMPGGGALHDALMPPMGEHIRPVLAYVQAHMQQDDVIYVYSGSVTQFRYYAFSYGLDTDHAIVAENSSGAKRFMDDVNNLKGTNRIWFIFSHVIGCGDCQGDKVQFYVQSLDKYGVQLDSFAAPGAAVFLYDLNP